MLSGRHPKKDVQAAIEAILADAWWRLERAKRGGHVWGVLKCGYERRGGCIVRINSTPQNPGILRAPSAPRGERLPTQRSLIRSSHSFTLLLADVSHVTDDEVNALYARCADATVSERDGAVRVSFDRKGGSFARAVLSAILSLDRLGFDVARIAADDVVSASDIAERTGRSREGVRLLVESARGPGSFPAPVQLIGDRQRLWRWPDVERWFAAYEGRVPRIEEHAAFVAAVNGVLDASRHADGLPPAELRAVRQLVREHQLTPA